MDADLEQVLKNLEIGLSTGRVELIRIAQHDLRDLLGRLPVARRAKISERILRRLYRRFGLLPWWNAVIKDVVRAPPPKDLAPVPDAPGCDESVPRRNTSSVDDRSP